MERISYTLKHPIEYVEGSGETARTVRIEALQLAPIIKGRHMRACDPARGPVEAKLLLIASLAGIARSEADELAEADIMAIDAIYGEDSDDMIAIAQALGLPLPASKDEVLAAIAGLKDRLPPDPLDAGATAPAGGRKTGPSLSAA